MMKVAIIMFLPVLSASAEVTKQLRQGRKLSGCGQLGTCKLTELVSGRETELAVGSNRTNSYVVNEGDRYTICCFGEEASGIVNKVSFSLVENSGLQQQRIEYASPWCMGGDRGLDVWVGDVPALAAGCGTTKSVQVEGTLWSSDADACFTEVIHLDAHCNCDFECPVNSSPVREGECPVDFSHCTCAPGFEHDDSSSECTETKAATPVPSAAPMNKPSASPTNKPSQEPSFHSLIPSHEIQSFVPSDIPYASYADSSGATLDVTFSSATASSVPGDAVLRATAKTVCNTLDQIMQQHMNDYDQRVGEGGFGSYTEASCELARFGGSPVDVGPPMTLRFDFYFACGGFFSRQCSGILCETHKAVQAAFEQQDPRISDLVSDLQGLPDTNPFSGTTNLMAVVVRFDDGFNCRD